MEATAQRARGVAVVLFAVILGMVAAGAILKGTFTSDDVSALSFLAYATVGLVIGLRQPRNAVGWLFLMVAIGPTLAFFTGEYARQSLLGENDLPLGKLAEWISSWAWFPGIAVLITFTLLLFPNGRVPSARWRWVGWLGVISIAVVVASMAFRPGPMESFSPSIPGSPNPVGIEGAGEIMEQSERLGFVVVPAVGLMCALSLIYRFRGASSQQRQQIKWFAYSALVLVLVILFERVLDRFVGNALSEALFVLGLMCPSIGAGIGILKYRLYDIDVIVNRTLVYASLTGLLAAVYFGSVVLLQRVLDSFTADSDLAVAASTLVVAALSRPFRARTQSFIDRRFYRRKYDAAETLERFAARLRDEVEITALTSQLVGVVRDTMQPSHASLWLRSSAEEGR